MTVKLNIGSLVIDAAAGQKINPATLKAAVERQLSGMIDAGGSPAFSSAPVKSLISNTSPMSGGVRGEARLAHDVARRIYEAMKR
jgi:hypothetical protein